MGKIISTEIKEGEKPLLLVYSNKKIVQNLISDEFQEKASLLFVSSNTPDNIKGEGIYHVNNEDIHLLPNIEEKVEYAIVILSSLSDKENIDSLLAKFRNDNTKAIIAIPANLYKDFVDVLLEVKNEKHIITALYGNILEENISENELLKIIRMGLSNKQISLSGNDLLPVFPISGNDLIVAIKHLLFSTSSKGLYFLFYKEPQTLHSAVHQLARIEPDLKFEINHEGTIKRFEERSNMASDLENKLQLKIHYLDNYLNGFQYAVEHLKDLPEKNIVNVKKKKRLFISRFKILRFSPSVSFALFLGFSLFVLLNVAFSILGLIFLRSSIQAFEKNDFPQAKQNGILAKSALSVPIPTLSVTEAVLSYFPFMKYVSNTLHLVAITIDLTSISSDLLKTVESTGKGVDGNTFEKIIKDAQYLYHAGSRVLLNQENRAIQNLLNPEVTKALALIPIAPTILGYDSPKEYLVLFQNNAELRPTGGFIGSAGRLIVEKGKIKEFEIFDVYDIDGQLTKHIEPNYIIRRNLQPHLYLRDSNFDLDFQESASLSALIYNLETKNTPDGVVAVDFNLIQKMLEVVGPIELKDYGKTVNADNSLDFLQSTIEEGFFPGSTQKKDILNELFKSITLKLEAHPEYIVKLGLAIPNLLEEKHILIAYQKDSIQSLISALNYGGRIPLDENANENFIYDTMGFSEANIGANKVNSNVSRSIMYNADLSSRLGVAKISLRNDSGDNSYKAYLRLITPKNSILRKITIDGKERKTIDAITDPKVYESRNFSPEKNVLEVDKVDEYNKTIFGTVIEVKRKSVVNIEYTYTNPSLFLDDGKDGYYLKTLKQPGTDNIPVKFTIRYPNEFAAKGERISSFGDGLVKFETNMKTDISYMLNFEKQ